MLKKFFIMITMLLTLSKAVYGYSSSFEYMLSTLDIAKQNVHGHFINEEIYNEYNLLVYGSPKVVTKNQRWKETKIGKWTKDGSSWNGSGIRGEYWILGENYFGKEVHNEVFPDDYNSNISPLEWNYVVIDDAEDSWTDASKYQKEEQKEYMLTQKLTRNGVTYDLTAEQIGTNKARAESFATWKTKGSIYTKKIDENGIYWGATFNVPPMAAEATLNSILNVENGLKYNMTKEQTTLNIPIDFGALITNLSELVSEKDIKTISAELLINGQKVDSITASERIKIDGSYNLNINKENYANQSTIEISLKCNTIAETCFDNDIPMSDSKEVILIINIDGEENKNIVENVNKRYTSGDKPKIASIEIKRVTTNNIGKELYTDLNIARKTNTEFVCAGQVIYVRVKTLNDTEKVTLEIEGDKNIITLDDLTKKFEWEEPRSRGVKTRFNSLSALQNQYKMPLKLKLEDDAGGGVRYFSTIYVIPYRTKQTLNSWTSLREENRNAFEINENNLFTRIEKPYSFVIKASSEVGVTTKRKSLDVFETWNTIYNRDLTKYIK